MQKTENCEFQDKENYSQTIVPQKKTKALIGKNQNAQKLVSEEDEHLGEMLVFRKRMFQKESNATKPFQLNLIECAPE